MLERIIRCPQCGAFVMKLRVLKLAPGSSVVIESAVRCRNRKCRYDVYFDTCIAAEAKNPEKK